MPNNKMLIDASHPEETRVVVIRGNRIEEFDFESQDKKQLKGNIYLARVTRVEPSLQAAFVEYGGNRHGFLAFSEIHPDYYQIPVADRQALLEAEAEDAHNDHDDEHDRDDHKERPRRSRRRGGRARDTGEDTNHADSSPDTSTDTIAAVSEEETATEAPVSDEISTNDTADVVVQIDEISDSSAVEAQDAETGQDSPAQPASSQDESEQPAAESATESDETADNGPASIAAAVEGDVISEAVSAEGEAEDEQDHGDTVEDVAAAHDDDDDVHHGNDNGNGNGDDHEVESVGAEDALEEVRSRRKSPRRQYKIQEVIKRRQILLVQVVKEERGNKGAALTTYLSLAGRYSVLMPNTARGGGISRKITSLQDRKRLKEIMTDLAVPAGMGVILRTAGESRTKAEIKRDYEYLMRMWENVRNLTLQSTAPTLVYEEGSLIKRSVRDLYNKDISEILVAGEQGYREAKDFMRLLMPSHAKVVQPYRETTPIFVRSGIEGQLDRMVQPQVTLKSGGYLIINQTEALVSIDVNSGRSTKEHSIEETALHTNLEAAEEVSRQLRLRDLAGLIVIDFIDMEESRNNRAVEKRLKECLKNDRARIQVGRISHFGLLEMSRQRIRASVLESTMKVCPHCGGAGHVRSDSSVALMVVRAIEEFLLKDARHHITVRTPTATALYVLNHKRSTLIELETRFGVTITLEADESTASQHYVIARGAVAEKPEGFVEIRAQTVIIDEPEPEDLVEDEEDVEETSTENAASEGDDQGENQRKRRRRRRRRGGKDRDHDEQVQETSADQDSDTSQDHADEAGGDEAEAVSEEESDAKQADDAQPRKRRRGKRGGRRNRNGDGDQASSDTSSETGDTETEVAPVSAMPEAKAEIIASDDAASDSNLEPQAETPGEDKPAIAAETSTNREEATSKAAPAAEAAPVEEEAPPAKPKRTRRTPVRTPRAKAAETASADTTAAEAETPVPSEPETDAEAVVPATKARARTRVAAKAAPVAKAPAEEAPVEKPKRTRRKAAVVEAPAEEPEIVVSSAPAESSEAEAAPSEEKPKRGGWWQRKGFF